MSPLDKPHPLLRAARICCELLLGELEMLSDAPTVKMRVDGEPARNNGSKRLRTRDTDPLPRLGGGHYGSKPPPDANLNGHRHSLTLADEYAPKVAAAQNDVKALLRLAYEMKDDLDTYRNNGGLQPDTEAETVTRLLRDFGGTDIETVAETLRKDHSFLRGRTRRDAERWVECHRVLHGRTPIMGWPLVVTDRDRLIFQLRADGLNDRQIGEDERVVLSQQRVNQIRKSLG